MTLKMEVGTVEMVPVEWIMQNTDYSVDGFNNNDGTVDFEELIRSKSVESGFGDLIGAILDKGFRVPIVLDVGYYDFLVTVGNGHHRLAAAILLCLSEIPVYWSSDNYMSIHVSATESTGRYEEWDDIIDTLEEIFWG